MADLEGAAKAREDVIAEVEAKLVAMAQSSQQERDDFHAHLDEARTQVAGLERDCAARDSRVAELEQFKAQHSQALAEVEAAETTTKRELEQLQAQHAQARIEVEAAETTTKHELEQLQAQHAQALIEVEAAETTKIFELEQLQAQHTQALTEVEAVLEEKRMSWIEDLESKHTSEARTV